MIPTQTLESFPIFGSNATKVEPGDAKKAAGWQQADVVPAEWMNWEWYKASKGITELNAGVSSIEKELNSVLTAAGNTPAESTDNQLLTSIMKVIHPVGSLWWTSKAPNNGGDPNVLFGGTWTQIKDRFVLAAGDTYTNGATGGAATVTLTTNQMPSHDHSGETGSNGADHTHNFEHIHFIEGTTKTQSNNHQHEYIYSATNTSGSGNYVAKVSESSSGTILYDGLVATKTTIEDQNHIHAYDGWSSTPRWKNNTSTERLNTGTGSASHTHTITSSGGGQAHNNMPPYVVKYCWERTA
jgi:microcystin-dependent protein